MSLCRNVDRRLFVCLFLTEILDKFNKTKQNPDKSQEVLPRGGR